MAENLQIYSYSSSLPCDVFACYAPANYLIARYDLDLGTALSTGYRVCDGCAKNLINNIPAELLALIKGPEAITPAEFTQHVVEASAVLTATEDTFDPIMPTAEPAAEETVEREPEAEPQDEEPEIEPEDEEEAQEAYRCLDCNREFVNKGSYIRHMNSTAHKK